jgi:hypothetical protein
VSLKRSLNFKGLKKKRKLSRTPSPLSPFSPRTATSPPPLLFPPAQLAQRSPASQRAAQLFSPSFLFLTGPTPSSSPSVPRGPTPLPLLFLSLPPADRQGPRVSPFSFLPPRPSSNSSAASGRSPPSAPFPPPSSLHQGALKHQLHSPAINFLCFLSIQVSPS